VNLPPIDFAALNEALLAQVDTLLANWLPGGVQRGHEYQAAQTSRGGIGDSLSVNVQTGRWGHFAGGESGGDLIGLYAYLNTLSPAQAAIQLAREHGLEHVAKVQPKGAGQGKQVGRVALTVVPSTPPAEPSAGGKAQATPASKARPKDNEGWATVMPVPDHAPEPTFWHFKRPDEDRTHTAAYVRDGALYGFVVRFVTSEGGKETLPYTWCTSARDGASKWHWRTFDEPRPLYLPGQVCAAGATVVLVEGERKADVLQTLLDAQAPGVYVVASWQGGCKAWEKADWSWLQGCTVMMWPDCDAHRERLTAKERKACESEEAAAKAQAAKPLLPPDKQPGMAAMLGIGTRLRDAHGCTVSLLQIPAPGQVPSGWDCANAIEDDGWDAERVLAFFGTAQPLLPTNGEKPPTAAPGGSGGGKKIDDPVDTGGAGSGGGGDDGGDYDCDAFAEDLHFICTQAKCQPWQLNVTRKLVISALRKAPAIKDCLGLNEMTGAPCALVAWPWRTSPGPLIDSDALRLGDWLTETYKTKAASLSALEEGIATVVDERRYHPVRDWLKALNHDGKTRIDKWLMHVLGKDPATMRPKLRTYYQKVGRYILMGLVARVMHPGCKFDYSMVLEGLTGRGKSTFIKALVGESFFSDTHFDIGNGKEGMEQLEGLWAYEMSELTPLRKADSDQVKQFFSSQKDRYRGAYEKYVAEHPRQCVIFCSTNKKHYLYDLTGNRRFWPVWIEHFIKLDWLQKWRDQLFAEAYALYMAGEPYYPTHEEEEEFFVPEQKKRLVETAVQSRLYELLTREGALSSSEGKLTADLNVNTKFVTLDKLVSALGADAAKSSGVLESQIRGWMDSQGWDFGREGSGQRRRGYKQPKVWPPVIDDDADEDRKDLLDTTPKAQDGPARPVTSEVDDNAPL
jgi:putative DNA primase/helicase